MRDELDMLLDDRGAEGFSDFLEHVPDAEWRLLELQLVGVDLREIQDVVEDAQQIARRRMGDADVLVRLRRQVGLESQTVHVDDRVHGRADLVAHHRQERSLRSIRLHGLLAGRDDGSMGHLLRGDGGVKGAAELAQFAAVVSQNPYGPRDRRRPPCAQWPGSGVPRAGTAPRQPARP